MAQCKAEGKKYKAPTTKGLGRTFMWADLEHVDTVVDDEKELARP